MKSNFYTLKVKTNSFSTSKLLLSLIVISILAVFFSAQGALSVYAQNEKKIIKLAYSHNPQLKFTGFKVGEQDRKLDESFDAESDWVKSLAFKLENISGRQIVYLQVNINFPETRSTGNLMSYRITFGQLPDSKFKPIKPRMLLKSGEILEVSLEKEKDKIYKFVNERQPFELIHTVELEIGFVIFDDKTAWNAGTFMRQDPNNPDRYNPIETESPH